MTRIICGTSAISKWETLNSVSWIQRGNFSNFAVVTIATIAGEWFLHYRCDHHDR